jgi:hypothetical protein
MDTAAIELLSAYADKAAGIDKGVAIFTASKVISFQSKFYKDFS